MEPGLRNDHPGIEDRRGRTTGGGAFHVVLQPTDTGLPLPTIGAEPDSFSASGRGRLRQACRIGLADIAPGIDLAVRPLPRGRLGPRLPAPCGFARLTDNQPAGQPAAAASAAMSRRARA